MAFETDAKRGVYNHYGPRTTISGMKFGGRQPDDVVKYATWQFNYNDLPTSGTNTHIFSLPAGAKVVNGWFQVDTAFAGGTSYDIDFVTSAGAAIGSGTDKLWDGLALAEIDATETVLDVQTHAGTNSGNVLGVPLASAGQLKVTATGTFTAGQAKITIAYMQPTP